MTNKVFFISDTHFGHTNILTFKNNDGSLLRNFPSIEEMDEHMVQQWNSVVRDQDKVYHLGDIVINKRSLPILRRLKGHKRLVRGNHDQENAATYLEYFEEVYGVRVFAREKFICSHIPLHPESVDRWGLNVHGHLHGNILKDPRYLSVCVEQINYTPVSMEEILDENSSLRYRGKRVKTNKDMVHSSKGHYD